MALFVANNLGVLAFDGNKWEVHAFKTGKKQRSLAFDESTNRLYVGSQGEFGFFQDDWEYTSLVEMIPSSARDFDEVWDVFLHQSKVYFCTFQGIYVYNGQSVTVIEHEDGFDRSFQVQGKLFTQSRRGAFFEVRNDELAAVHPQKRTDQIIAGVVAREEGYLLIYNSGDIELSTFFDLADQYAKLSEALRGKYVNHVLQLSDGRLAISTQTAGLFLYDLSDQSIENITSRDGLLSNACLRAFQDYEGNLWVGMQYGIAVIGINSPIRLINREANIQGSGYEAFETEEGTYYTTSNGIYFLAKDARQSIFLSGTEGPAYGMREIAGKLYAGHHTGLFLLEEGRAKRLANTDGLWQVQQLRSRPGYAIGGAYSGLYLFRIDENMELQAVRKLKGFAESSRFFEEDRKGRIWVGQFYKGLYRLELSEDMTELSVKRVSGSADLPIDEQVILSRINDELYLATYAGIYKIDQTTDRIVEAEMFAEVVGKQPVSLLVQDRQKNIYVFADNLVGFFKQVSSNNYVFLSSSLFQMRYSFNNDLLQASVNTADGVLFNANEGYIQYDHELEDRAMIERPLSVNRVFSVMENRNLFARKPFEERRENVGRLVASQSAKVLQFQVASYQFQDVSNQQFRYFLKGFDESYSEWTDATTKEYTNLPEGKYEFTVQIRNHLGEIRTSKPIVVSMKPPFYKSLLAFVLYSALGLAALFLLFRLQRRKYKQRAIKLEESKQIALAKKQLELVAVEKQKSLELLQLQEENMQSELRHLNNLLAASTMNLVVKNEFIETIKEELKEVRRKGRNVETKQALEKIVKEIDTTLRIQEDWEQFELHFDQVHGDFSTRLRNEFHDLTPSEHKLSVFLRLNLNTKEIANLMGISVRGVEVARYRLRKKLNLQTGQNLSKFILEY